MSIITTKESRVFDWSNPGTLKVGDEIAETLNDGRKVVFVVMDDGVIGLKGLLLDCQRMNDDWKKIGWLASDLRHYLNEEVIELLPDDLLAAIKPRKFGDEEDRLWLFSEVEIFGEHILGAGDEGDNQLEYFKDPFNRIKFNEDGDAGWWWERSPCASPSNYFCIVSNSGDACDYYANGSSGVCFGFYIRAVSKKWIEVVTMTIKYEADAHISIQTEIMVPENATDDDILLAIMLDLMDRYGFMVNVKK